MASTTKPEFSTAQLLQLVYDYDNQFRQAVEVGVDGVRETFRRIDLQNILPLPPHVFDLLPNEVFMLALISSWFKRTKTKRDLPAYINQLRADARRIKPMPQPTSPTASASVHDTSSTIPAPAPTVRPVTTPSAVPLAIPVAAPSATEPTVPLAAPTIPAVATHSVTEPSTSTTPVTKTVTYNSAASNLAVLKFGPPKRAARDNSDAPTSSAPTKPAESNPAKSKPAASKPATFETDSEDDSEPNNDIEDDEEQPDEDEEQQPAEGSRSYKRRRQPVKLVAIHEPSCDRCERGKRTCHKEAVGGACFSCVVLRSKCNYARSGKKEVSDREYRDVKGKAKAKGNTQRKSKEFVGDEIDLSRIKGSKSKQKWVESDDENQKKSKQPVRRMKTATGSRPSAAPSQQLSPELEVVLNGVQSQLRQLVGEIRDNFDTCDVMSGRVKHIASQIGHVKNMASEMTEMKTEMEEMATEMKEVKKLLRKVLRRLPEEDHSSVIYVSGDEVMIDNKVKPARFRSITHKDTRRPVTRFTVPSHSHLAARPVTRYTFHSHSPPAAAADELPYSAQLPTLACSPAAGATSSTAAPVETPFNANPAGVTPAIAFRSNVGNDESTNPGDLPNNFSPLNSPSNLFDYGTESDTYFGYNLTLEDTPLFTPSPSANKAEDVADSVIPNDLILEPPNDIRMTRLKSQNTAPAVKRKAGNAGTGRTTKRRK